MTIEGKHVRLRAVEDADFDPYFRFLSRAPDWAMVDIYAPIPRKLAQEWFAELALPFDETRKLFYVIESLADRRAVGDVTLGPVDLVFRRAEIGIAIWDPQDRKRGFSRESLALACAEAFDRLNLHRLEAGINASNAGSMALFERAGFKREGAFRERVFHGGRYEDEVFFGLLEDEWRVLKKRPE